MTANWPTVLLGDIAVITMGQSPPGETYNTTGDGLPFFQGKAEFGPEIPTVVKWCSAPQRTAHAGDILLSVRAPVGPTNMAVEECCIGRGLAAIRAKEGIANTRFLRYFLRRFESDLARQGVGSTFSAINRRDIEKMQLLLPPVRDQERIVSILDAAGDLRRLREQADRRTADMIPALFHEMFGDPVTNPKSWNVRRLGELLDFLTSGSRGWGRYYALDGDLFLRIQNVGRNELLLDDVAYVRPPANAEAKRTLVKAGDVLLSITADLGRTAVIPESITCAYINQHLALLRTTKTEPLYLSAFLSSPGGKRQIAHLDRDAVKAGLNFDDIRSLEISLPPRPLQCEFAARVVSIREMEAKQAESRRRLDDLFQSLLHRAFRGEV